MKSILKIITLSCCLTALLVSCADDEFTRPGIVTIAVQGQVTQLDEFKNPQTGDFSGIVVTFKRRTTQVVSYETTTNADGEFTLPDVIKSEYIIECSKPGYQTSSTVYLPPLSDVEGVTIPDLTLRQNSTTVPAITSIVRDNEAFEFTFSGTFSPSATATERRGVLIIITNSQDIPDYDDVALFRTTIIEDSGDTFTYTVSGFTLLDSDIQSGSAYVHVFGLSSTDEANQTEALSQPNLMPGAIVTQQFQLNLN